MYEAIHYLRSIDPRLPYLLIAGLVGGVIWLWRQLHPSSFDRLSPRVKALPAALVGLILGASTTEGLPSLMVDLVAGAFAGVTAVGAHETVRRLKEGTGHRRPNEPSSPAPRPEHLPEHLTESHTRPREGGFTNGS